MVEPKIRVLVISTMFPNPIQPVYAVFVHRRLAHAASHCEYRVLAPIPFFPLSHLLLERYAIRRKIPKEALYGNIPVQYPRFLSIPRLFKPLDGLFLFFTCWWHARKIRKTFPFDLIDSQLAFPDGFAAYLLSRIFKVPFTITLRGHDVNHLPVFPVRRRQITLALKGAARVMAVAEALRKAAVALGCPSKNTETIPNGVDRALFFPGDRSEARELLGLPRSSKVVLTVGHLVERKGHHLVVQALALMVAQSSEELFLAIVGGPGEEGDLRELIEGEVARLGLKSRVRLVGPVANEDLQPWFCAADLFCLASSKEGWANVLLESLACGTPVVATNVWGTPEVICSPALGILVDRTVESIAAGLLEGLKRTWDREELVLYASRFTWEQVGAKVAENYRLALRLR